MPLTTERDTKKLGERAEPELLELAVGDAETIYQGALVCLDATGYAVPGATATTLTAVGRAEATVDNSAGADGDKTVKVRRGVFKFANSAGGDEIVQADLLTTNCYIVDDETVAKTDGTSTRSAAGKVYGIDSDGVWVGVGMS
ncbi:MAG: hypothetical protein R3337_00385 [Gammaproteobacteria bacterium]|nr:hypothetical protein [Gammaproteobacteria bacterium]